MNVKSLAPNIIQLDVASRGLEKTVRAEPGDDRDGNGRREQDQEPAKEHLTDAEVQKVLDRVRGLEGVRQNNLTVQCVVRGSRQFFVINDPEGKVVRRFSAAEAWAMLRQDHPTRAGLLHKSA
jgi:hypothetical protein